MAQNRQAAQLAAMQATMLPIIQGREPVETVCPKCRETVMTQIDKKFDGWMWVMLLILIPPLCFIPCFCGCCGLCKKVTHYCTNCKHAIGMAA